MTREEYDAEVKAIDADIDEQEAIIREAKNKLVRLHAERGSLKYMYLTERAAVQRHMDRD